MYNITLRGRHPAVICVEISKLVDSLKAFPSILSSDYIEEGVQEFIEQYSRTEEVMPDDKTVGFVVVNSEKKVISLSFTSLDQNMVKELESAMDGFRKIGYSVDMDIG